MSVLPCRKIWLSSVLPRILQRLFLISRAFSPCGFEARRGQDHTGPYDPEGKKSILEEAARLKAKGAKPCTSYRHGDYWRS